MADFRIALGGTISAATTDEMHSALGDVKRDILNGIAGSKAKPVMRPLTQSGTGQAYTTGQSTILNMGRPSAGRLWVVTRVVVLGEDDVTTHTNLLAALYIGDVQTAALGQCVRSGTSIPYTTTENERAYVVGSREDFFVKYTAIGATTVPNLTVNALAWEYRESDINPMAV